ncbi:MAG: MFS transporter [Acidimicrobiia bacterium]|nr:MFS transporter [Acidimicrobiia bacterium]
MADMSSPTTTPRRSPSPGVVLAIVGYAVFVAADDLTVVTTMLRPIVDDLGLVLPDGLDDAAWIVNAYLIAFVAAMPIAGRISDVIGRRRTLVGAYVIFLAGTTLIPLTSSLGPFLVGRILTAVGGGAMVPVALAVVGDVYPERSRARALGTLGAIETMGWVWGPLYGALLVRFLDWRWQFWLNIPLAVVGLVSMWWALADHDQVRKHDRIDWIGAGALTATLVSLNLALLGNAEIQSVSGLDELTGGTGPDFRWFYLVAVGTGSFLVWQQRRTAAPLLDRSLFAGWNLRIALAVNFVVGAVLVIAMVDVPIFVNAVEVDLERSAVLAGWVLSALTVAMATAAYLGGRITERTWYRPPVLIGLGAATVGFVLMGLTWEPATSAWMLAAQLALLGAGLGLVVAPTTSAIVDATAPEDRGAAAGLVMVVRLVGLSVGLSALTAWGLGRFNALRGDLVLPPITDPGFESAVLTAQANLTADALGETFLAAAAITLVGLGIAAAMRRRGATSVAVPSSPHPRQGELMQESWLLRHIGWIVGVMAVLVVGALVLVAVLFGQLQQTKDDLARVEAGSALFASQVSGFQQQLADLEPLVSEGLDDAIEGLDAFRTSTLEFTVAIDEEVTIETEIVLDREISVPINESLPIRQTFDTTISVDTPLGFSVPVDVSVPIDVDVPIELDLNIPVNETVPVSTTVPVKLDVPITVDVADTELAALAASLSDGLASFDGLLAGLGG